MGERNVDFFDGQQSATPPNVTAPATTPLTNAVINGNMLVWNEGTSFAAISTNVYFTEMFQYSKSGAMVHTASRVNEGLGVFSTKLDCTTIDGSIAAGDRNTIIHRIEGNRLIEYWGKTCTLAFDVYDTKTGTHCIAFRNSGPDRSYVVEYNVDVTNTYQRIYVQVPLTETGGTWDYINGVGLIIDWVLAAGSTWQTTKDAWQTGNFFATSSQVNAVDNTANDFKIKNVDFYVGTHERDFAPAGGGGRAHEQALTLPYYRKSYDLDIVPGTANTDGMINLIVPVAGTGSMFTSVHFDIPSRTSAPSVTLYDQAGTPDKVYKAADGKTATVLNVGKKGFTGGTSDATSAAQMRFQFTVNDRM